MTSILQDWVTSLPIRYQGVLIAAVRGCDGQRKENTAKPLTRALRFAFMHPADEREVGHPSAFMADGFTDDDVRAFLKDWDHYPMHFVQHLLHAAQVIGVAHPEGKTRTMFRELYYDMVNKLHLMPESRVQMHERLTEDRIAKYGDKHGELS